MLITLESGKYTIYREGYITKALRYGVEWRDFTGDKMFNSLLDYIEDAEQAAFNKGYEEGIHRAGM